jgi:chemotaxis protein CheZ
MNAKAHPDADDLEALFDSIAAQQPSAPAARAAAAPAAVAATNDSDDLEALFDSVAAQRTAPPTTPAVAAAAAPVPAPAPAAGDSDELEALFDRVASARAPAAPAATPSVQAGAAAAAEDPAEHLFHRVGQLTRTLHDALRELGYDKKIATAANSLPDARDRLVYIATLTGQAAERVLGAVEAAQDDERRLEAASRGLAERWRRLYANELSVDEFKVLAGETRDFLAGVPAHAGAVQQRLHEIMMAQDFHDLTGQVIKKVVDLAATLESSLVALLVETQQAERKPDEGWLSGPAVRTDRPDVVANQAQVDSLLESLGF